MTNMDVLKCNTTYTVHYQTVIKQVDCVILMRHARTDFTSQKTNIVHVTAICGA